MRRLSVAVVAACLVAALAPATGAQTPEPTFQGNGDAGGFLNVMPPGQDGVLNAAEAARYQADGTTPAHFNDQTAMYGDLVYAAGIPSDPQSRGLGITDGDLTTYFKDASFGFTGEEEERISPTEGLVIVRDSRFGVPHIYGETREAAMFGAGYATAQDRLFLMDVLRHLGRARLSEFLGASDANKAMDIDQLQVAPYLEEELTAQVAAICATSAEGQRACDDVAAYSAGVNAYIDEALADPSKLPAEYEALQQMPAEWIVEDVVAIASLVGGIFGRGGGGEVAVGRFLSQLQERYGDEEGRRIFDDFRSADDPDAPVTTRRRFPYGIDDTSDPAAVALLDLESAEEAAADLATGPLLIDGPFGPIDLGTPDGMSNAIVAGASVTDGGTPVAVFGPQTGYFTPQLLVEMDIHGPGIDARGAAFAGTNIYVQLGRGRDYAWSATSASGDNVDEWVLELCEPDGSAPTTESDHYVHDGECKAMDVYTHRQIAKPSAGGIPSSPDPRNIVFDVEVRRSVYGPVVTTGTVGGKPVAVAEQRSTYGSELASAIGFQRINDPDYMSGGVESFLTAFDGVDFTFNWFYVDDTDIAYKHSCRCPVRDPRVDESLPAWGNGTYDWTGTWLAPAQQPQEVNPASGFFANWNNKQAPGFRAADDQFSYSSTYRSEFLRQRMAAAIAAGRKLTRSDMVDIAEDAGTVDLNGSQIYPLALAILDRAGVTAEGRTAAMVNHLRAWVAAGGHRRDADRDGTYEHAVAISIGDALLVPLLDNVFGDELEGADLPQRVEDHPRQSVGSAYNGGRANFLHKDFRQVLGLPVAQERSRTYCGVTPADCADRILEAVNTAGDALQAAYETDDVDAWVYDKSLDEIDQSAVGLPDAPNIPWINRPTFHQTVQVGDRTGRIDEPSAAALLAAMSRHARPAGAATVVVVPSSWQYGLMAAPLAAVREAVVLSSRRRSLSPATAREIRRLGATEAIVLGGESLLSEAVAEDLTEAGVQTVTRVRGRTPAAVARRTAKRVGEHERAFVVSSSAPRHALALGAVAGLAKQPVLFTARRSLPKATRLALESEESVVVVGGVNRVSSAVTRAIGQAGVDVRRVGGRRAAVTAARLLRDQPAGSLPYRQIYVVALGGRTTAASTALAGAVNLRGGVILPVSAEGDRSKATEGLLHNRRGAVQRLFVVAGQQALPSSARARLRGLLAG